MKEFTVVIEKDEDNWLVSMVLELPGCHSQGKTMDELLERTREAIGVYLEALDERELEPRIEFVGVQRVKV
ncbi:MAG: type II toxin-antitoxin system HicB family antitoxin [Candidatus Atribacteria bacterium]|nr:type II toxin-antitoxin system HicB family antitoxin [Candidatus Atribacteria bacterium]